jgi:hypothetical protein
MLIRITAPHFTAEMVKGGDVKWTRENLILFTLMSAGGPGAR